jgi:hypothetical protein
MTWPIASNPSSSLIASILLSLEEAANPESAKDSVRYPATIDASDRSDFLKLGPGLRWYG